MHAVKNKNIDIIKLLLEQEGIDLSLKDDDDKTIYDLAKESDDNEIINLFN